MSYAEKILIDLENNDLTLEEAVENYTEALARIKLAKKILEDTQNKVEIIERRDLDGVSTKKLRQSNDGRTTLEPEAEEKALKLLIDENIKTVSNLHENSMTYSKDCSFSRKVLKQFGKLLNTGYKEEKG